MTNSMLQTVPRRARKAENIILFSISFGRMDKYTLHFALCHVHKFLDQHQYKRQYDQTDAQNTINVWSVAVNAEHLDYDTGDNQHCRSEKRGSSNRDELRASHKRPCRDKLNEAGAGDLYQLKHRANRHKIRIGESPHHCTQYGAQQRRAEYQHKRRHVARIFDHNIRQRLHHCRQHQVAIGGAQQQTCSIRICDERIAADRDAYVHQEGVHRFLYIHRAMIQHIRPKEGERDHQRVEQRSNLKMLHRVDCEITAEIHEM
mmetsp:Transcript_17377/g.27723  ORF Transcript_17377/g.27723 Transcript_17377/m.27723 type:complete len:260 (+) Transcript_17377:381-1160(+)